VAFSPEVLLAISEIPNDRYFSQYKSIDKKTEEIARKTEEFLMDTGFHVKAITRENRDTNDGEKTTRLPYKTVATRAGIGWIGKCALLTTKEYGAGIRIISVLTDAPLKTGEPINESMCGDCMECVNACPGKAAKGGNWSLKSDRKDIFDAFACADYVAQRGMKYNYGRTTVTCGLCILACPWTKKYIERSI
jgi:epoxyqueuosine reductase QueG